MIVKRKILLVLGILAAIAASPSLSAAQFARPDATTASAGWTAVNAPTHHEALDEISANDTDYIDSGANNPSTVILGLSNVSDPGSYANNHILRYRCQSTSGKGGAELCNAALYDGGTLIFDTGAVTANRGAYAQHQFTIPDASGITDYTNLSIQLTVDIGNGESMQVSWFELEVPDQTVTPATVTSPTFADVTDTTATLGGTVSVDGAPPVTDRGVEWGTTPGGPWPNSVALGTGGTGAFTVPVTGLPSSSTIYFRAWADNGVKAYSAESSFTTNAPASLPTVGSPTFASVTSNTAILGGTVSADGGAAVTARGVVWNTASPAESGGTVVQMGSGTGTFSQLVSGLPAGTLIFFKAYATNSAGTSYSTESSFTTLVGLATVDSPTVANIAATSADLGGTVSADGGATVTERGIVWNTSTPPEIGGTVVPIGSGLGTFSQNVGSLPTGTLVYFRAYATNTAGTAYSSIASFTPAGPPLVTSPTATGITHNSAILGGTITSNGGSPILSRGTVWNTTGSPVVENALAEGGSGLGTFSHTRSLPAGTTIFYRAYAVNATGTGYSTQSSFVTATEPTLQATNVTFPKVSGRSQRVDWTRGNGDGSIVVMRLASTAKAAPVDGVDYAANSDYTQAPEIGTSQNFVVFKGPSNDAWVTGLTLSTNYSVAVYEYAGTGANTDYLQLTPAEASQATTDTPVHNEDNRVNCSDCHSHGSWDPHTAELKVSCEICHTPLGSAEAKQMFDNHLTPGKNPSIDVVACGYCHELHTPIGENTTESFNNVTGLTQRNKSFLRANVDKYVPNAVPPAYLHTDQPLREAGNPNGDPEALAVTPDRAVEGGTDAIDPSSDTQARGYCQVCHTMTSNHTNNPSTSGSDQSHDGELNNSGQGTETNCGTCHQHKSAFAGIGGTATCESCHSSEQGTIPRPIITTQFDRLSSHITGGSTVAVQEDCMVCHDQSGHQTQIVRLWDADDGITSFAQLTPGASTTDPAEAEQFEGHCLSCHDDGVASSLPAFTGDTAGQTDTSPFNGSAAPPIIDEVAWASAAHNRSTTPIVSCLGSCHGSGHGSEQNKLLSPAGGPAVSAIDFCFNCHDADGPSTKDIQAEFNTATNYQDTANGGALINQRHDITAADQSYSGGVVSCKDCHSPHVDNAANPVADPDTGLALATYSIANSYTDDGHNFAYNSGGNSDPNNPETGVIGPTEPDYIQFCLTCHDGTAPPGVTMSANLTNIASAWAGDQHGAGEGSTGTRFGKGTLKYPYTVGDGTTDPANPYAAMNCNTCHGAHGSGSIFNLRDSITVAGVQMTIGGLSIDSEFPKPTFDGPTYTLPVNGGTQADHVYGAWCTFCHDQSAHAGVDETTVCTSAHMHGGNSF